jgi:hypothetical protein
VEYRLKDRIATNGRCRDAKPYETNDNLTKWSSRNKWCAQRMRQSRQLSRSTLMLHERFVLGDTSERAPREKNTNMGYIGQIPPPLLEICCCRAHQNDRSPGLSQMRAAPEDELIPVPNGTKSHHCSEGLAFSPRHSVRRFSPAGRCLQAQTMVVHR